MKDIKVHIGNGEPAPGWFHVKGFEEFTLLLDTYPVSKMSAIHFGPIDEDEEMNSTDYAVELVSRGGGKKLPNCLVSSREKDVLHILDHYTSSYKFDNPCIKL